MLRIPRIDRVVLTLSIDPKWFSVVIDNLHCTCIEYGYKCKAYHKNHMQCWDAMMEICGERLRISIRQAYQYKWIEYSFTGEIDFAAFQEKLLLLQEYGLGNALTQGRIKRLELALDLPGLHTSALVCHCFGAHSGFVKQNPAGTGVTYYLGSLDSNRQFVMYDKNQQLRDMGKMATPGEMLRIELRLYRKEFPLAHAAMHLEQSDLFSKFCFAYRSAMLTKPTKIATWGMLINACIQQGAPAALKAFPEQKKTFLNHLRDSRLNVAPRFKDFAPAFSRILAKTKAMNPIDHVGLPVPL